MRIALFVLSFLVMGFGLQATAPALADGHLPQCHDQKVLSKLAKRFNRTERIYFEDRGLHLNGISRPHHHSTYQLADSEIGRRYCHGTALFENGKNRRVHYLIEENAGFAGFGWNVEYCIHGLDESKYYGGRCRVLSH